MIEQINRRILSFFILYFFQTSILNLYFEYFAILYGKILPIYFARQFANDSIFNSIKRVLLWIHSRPIIPEFMSERLCAFELYSITMNSSSAAALGIRWIFAQDADNKKKTLNPCRSINLRLALIINEM